MPESSRTLLSLVLAKFRDVEPDHPMAVIETERGEIVRLTYGDLCNLGEELAVDRTRANEVAREVADLRDELSSVRVEIEDLRAQLDDQPLAGTTSGGDQ